MLTKPVQSCLQFDLKIVCEIINRLPHMPILDSSNSAANKDMMSKILTNGIQFSDCVENIVGKEESARYEQFLLFPQGFQKLSVVDVLTHSHTMTPFDVGNKPFETSFENTVGKVCS